MTIESKYAILITVQVVHTTFFLQQGGTMQKTISPVTPWLVQRCKLDGGKFCYDYMGSSEFEFGDQATALKQLFSGKIAKLEVVVEASDGGGEVPVYLLAQDGFDAAAYQPHLQRLADDKMRLQEAARFSDAVNVKAQREELRFYRLSEYDIWFDFTMSGGEQNIVLWTLDPMKREELLARLYVVTSTWVNEKSA